MGMTEEQFERYMQAYERRTDKMEDIASSLSDIGMSIRTMYDGTSTSAFYGMSQAFFTISDSLKDIAQVYESKK